jgi:hypothetical protein
VIDHCLPVSDDACGGQSPRLGIHNAEGSNWKLGSQFIVIVPSLWQRHAPTDAMIIPDCLRLRHPSVKSGKALPHSQVGIKYRPSPDHRDNAFEGTPDAVWQNAFAEQNRAKEILLNAPFNAGEALPRLLFLRRAATRDERRCGVSTEAA